MDSAIKVKSTGRKILDEAKIRHGGSYNDVIVRFGQLSQQQSKFEIEDVRLMLTSDFKIKVDETIGNVNVIRAVRGDIRIDCTQNLTTDKIINLTVVKSIPNIDHAKYTKLKQSFVDFEFDVIIRIDGDLDTINILNNPEQYDLDLGKAFKFINKQSSFQMINQC